MLAAPRTLVSRTFNNPRVAKLTPLQLERVRIKWRRYRRHRLALFPLELLRLVLPFIRVPSFCYRLGVELYFDASDWFMNPYRTWPLSAHEEDYRDRGCDACVEKDWWEKRALREDKRRQTSDTYRRTKLGDWSRTYVMEDSKDSTNKPFKSGKRTKKTRRGRRPKSRYVSWEDEASGHRITVKQRPVVSERVGRGGSGGARKDKWRFHNVDEDDVVWEHRFDAIELPTDWWNPSEESGSDPYYIWRRYELSGFLYG